VSFRVPTLTEAIDVQRRVEASGVAVQIGYQRRFDAGFVAARAAVANGELGVLYTVSATTLDPAPPPADYIATSGDIFRDCSVHDLDAIRFVTGQEVTQAYAARSLDSIAVGLDNKLPLRSVEPDIDFPAEPPHQFFMDRFLAAYIAELEAFTEVVAGTRRSGRRTPQIIVQLRSRQAHSYA
jgi:myo-inositol 2-dehydrogenase / D-chiro-inositol 1-dehydrogenase